MTGTDAPKCPQCQKKKAVPHGDRNWFCTNCKAIFDDDPDEGGPGYNNPAVNAERKEEFQLRERARRQRSRRY